MQEIKTVLVTGASGYIAKHIILQLLEAGYTVRASLRSPARAGEVRDAVLPHLAATGAAASRLGFVTLDLASDDGWPQALAGVDALLHTASPFPLEQPANAQDLIRPAVDGTLRALRAAKAAGVNRVVLTSSSVAISNTEPPKDRPFDEGDWSTPGYKTETPYVQSKLKAEQAAWDFVKTEAPQIELTVINPVFVLGPPLDRHYGTSIRVIERFLRGKDPMLPDIGFNCVDVRDIAQMHVRALAAPASIGMRIIGSASFLTFQDMAKAMKARFPKRRIPTMVAPHWFIKLLGLFDKAIASIIPALGRRESISNARAREILGIEFRDPRTSVVEAAEFLVEQKLA
jgi:dihydroflavonol-4-reductase